MRALMAAPDGSLYAAGTVEQSGFVAHISAAGERIGWLDLDKAASALAMDGDGAVYASGTGFIEKLDANLNLIARIDLSGTAAAIAVRQDGAIFAGDDSRLVTYSSKGDVLNTFDFGAGTIINGVALDASGAIFVTGSTSSLNLPAARNSMTGPQDAYVAKIGSGGTVEWSARRRKRHRRGGSNRTASGRSAGDCRIHLTLPIFRAPLPAIAGMAAKTVSPPSWTHKGTSPHPVISEPPQ